MIWRRRGSLSNSSAERSTKQLVPNRPSRSLGVTYARAERPQISPIHAIPITKAPSMTAAIKVSTSACPRTNPYTTSPAATVAKASNAPFNVLCIGGRLKATGLRWHRTVVRSALRQWRPAMHAASFYGRAVHRDERYDDERDRDHPHPHHVGQIARCDVVASERVRACDQLALSLGTFAALVRSRTRKRQR